jgi:tight adherence protein B
MNDFLQSTGFYYLAKWGALLLLGLAVLFAVYGEITDETSLPNKLWARYVGWIDARLRNLFVFFPAKTIVLGQVAACALVLLGEVLFGIPLWGAGILLILAAPAIWIESERRKRIALIEDQLDGFILALANALKSTPSIGAALASLKDIVQAPLSFELDLALKEMRVGSTVDQALLAMAVRIGSRSVESSLSAVLIGRQVGGNLPRVLEGTAASVREMKRLDGVVRTKTAEGKAQLWVIGALPFGLVIILNRMNNQYFDPMLANFYGYGLVGAAVICWLTAIVLARKVLAVDL